MVSAVEEQTGEKTHQSLVKTVASRGSWKLTQTFLEQLLLVQKYNAIKEKLVEVICSLELKLQMYLILMIFCTKDVADSNDIQNIILNEKHLDLDTLCADRIGPYRTISLEKGYSDYILLVQDLFLPAINNLMKPVTEGKLASEKIKLNFRILVCHLLYAQVPSYSRHNQKGIIILKPFHVARQNYIKQSVARMVLSDPAVLDHYLTGF